MRILACVLEKYGDLAHFSVRFPFTGQVKAGKMLRFLRFDDEKEVLRLYEGNSNPRARL